MFESAFRARSYCILLHLGGSLGQLAPTCRAWRRSETQGVRGVGQKIHERPILAALQSGSISTRVGINAQRTDPVARPAALLAAPFERTNESRSREPSTRSSRHAVLRRMTTYVNSWTFPHGVVWASVADEIL